MPKKSYSESEVSSIIGRAARLQASNASAGEENLTLEEIKKAAAEAGIDERYIELAASESADHFHTYWNIPTGVSRSQFVNGSLTDEVWEQMKAAFSREFGGPGETTVQENRRDWAIGSLRITAEEIGDQIALHAQTEWGGDLETPIVFSIVGGIAALMTSAIALVSQEFLIGVVGALLSVLVVGFFSAFHVRKVRKQKQLRTQFEAVLDRCAGILYKQDDSNPLIPDRESLPGESPGVRSPKGRNRTS